MYPSEINSNPTFTNKTKGKELMHKKVGSEHWLPIRTVLLLFSRYVVSNSFGTPWTVACQAPLSMRFPRQEYWNELPFPSPGDRPNPGIKPVYPASSALAGGVFPTESSEKSTMADFELPKGRH